MNDREWIFYDTFYVEMVMVTLNPLTYFLSYIK